jgi:hypothetical protein
MFHRFAQFILGSARSSRFQSFNRFAPFKTLSDNEDSDKITTAIQVDDQYFVGF